MTPELHATWRTRCCPDADVELRAPALVERTADEMRTAGDEVTIRMVWSALAERCPKVLDVKVLSAAAVLAGVALGL